MRANPFREPLEGMVLKIETFLGPEMAPYGRKKVSIFRAHPFPMALEMAGHKKAQKVGKQYGQISYHHFHIL
jgi:hypothetical protein